MSEFHVDMRDIRFNLFDFLDVGALTRAPRYEDYDAEIFDDVISACYTQARELIHPLNAQGDRVGVVMEDGRVKMPAGWKRAYDEYRKAGWQAMSLPMEVGGQGLPVSIYAAVQDMFIGANVSFLFTPGLSTGAMNLIVAFGTPDQKATYLDKMVSGAWSGTMCLTEAGAGTAVPDLKSAAELVPDRDGLYKIKGQKIFISCGDHDLTENIVHMVLARAGDDEGVSLFIVPRMRPTADGGLEYNDVATVGIEEKLGIHASPTVSLSFGDEDDCYGSLIGERGHGLRCMFLMMNEARIAVGLQGVGLANTAYQLAMRYAKERIQGTRIQEARKRDAARVAIIEHPDVRRMLMFMKAIAEGNRAVAYYASYCHDREVTATDEREEKRWRHQLEILTPIVKAWCSDEAFRAAEAGVQVHGGYGYCVEYGAEQILRDVKIASIYEGANGIQALDLLGRKLSRGGGVMLMTMLNEINKFVNGPAKEGAFTDEVAALVKARDAVGKSAMSFAKRSMKGDVEYSALHATPFLQMFGDLIVGWLLLRHAVLAQKLYDARLQSKAVDGLNEELGQILEDDAEARYLHGKIATAHFFVHQILPRVHARVMSIESEDRSALSVVL